MVRSVVSKVQMVALVAATGVCATTALSLLYLGRYRPPGCNDPRTLAEVRQEIRHRIGAASLPELVRVVTIAGSRFGIRYLCKAEFSNPDRLELSNGVLVNSVRYSSELTSAHHPHVAVSLVPILQWQELE